MSTLAELILDCQEEMGEVHGTEGHRDPFPWERHLRAAADEVCRRSCCYYTTVTYDVTAGQSPVVQGGCSCPVFEIEEARVGDPSSWTGFSYLELVTPRDFPNCPWFSADWRNFPTMGTPVALVIAGLNNLRLYGTPSVDSLGGSGGGLLVTGYATVGGTDAMGAPLIALTDELPLPGRAEEAVKLGAMLRRARSYPKEYGSRYAMLKADYADALGDLNAEARSQSRANTRVG